ncbi:PAS domain-containing protein [Granulicella rosea]|uniref:PAS domain-containing protein n=1 Tax=Granulicella rosea TaxID=474952 RepID=UPI00115DBC02|nr:PAS domain-containing protein [Granulicella rosea]
MIAEVSAASSPGSRSACTLTAFDHEDIFLQRVIAAGLDDRATCDLISAALLTVSQPTRPRAWVELELDLRQMAALGLEQGQPESESSAPHLPFTGNMLAFHQFLLQAPTPFVMLSGPEHRFTFINQPYVELIGRTSKEEILGKTVRAVLPELEGQPFFHLLDEVFRTQIPYVGIEVPGRLRRPNGLGYDDRHFDFIYHPVVGQNGKTSGIMVQASDVTEKVLAREVSERREQQMFRFWEELDTIYRSSPAAMALFRADDLTILRLNGKQAEWMGSTAAELTGRRITSMPFHNPLYVSLLRRAAAGEAIRDYVFRDMFCDEVMPVRIFRLSLTPVRNPSGEIEAVSSIAVEHLSGADAGEVCVRAESLPVL